ncbi:MAG: hypothetical protein AAGB31_15495, partial [Bdellovibrio sp.]
HEYYAQYFPSGFFDYDFYLKDTVQADEFIQLELYRPSGCYAVSKLGRASISVTMPPMAGENTKTLDETNIINPSSLRIVRTYSENFYNSVVYKYEKDAVEDEYLRGRITYSQKSVSRVPNVKNISYKIESDGIRSSLESRSKIDTQARKILDRYQYGAEKISNIEVLYKVGYDIDVGETVIFGSAALQISDSTLGTRAFRPRAMEVVNKRVYPTQGKVVLDLLNTAYALNAKYGTVSPSSLVGNGASSSVIVLKHGLATPTLKAENYKWTRYVGEKIRVRDSDFTVIGESTIIGFSESNTNHMLISPPLGFTPLENYIVEPMPYSDNESTKWKDFHVYFNPRVFVESSPSSNQIEVGASDVDKFVVGSILRIHSQDFTFDSDALEFRVVAIVGNILTLNEAVGFSVLPGYVLDLIGFKDGGAPYRLL